MGLGFGVSLLTGYINMPGQFTEEEKHGPSRTKADGASVLHKLRGIEVHSQRGPGKEGQGKYLKLFTEEET